MAADHRDPLAALRAALEAGSDPARVLLDPRAQPLRDDPASRPQLRRLLREHAPQGAVTVVGPDELGARLQLRTRLLDADGAPVGGGLVFLCHADATGRYAPEAPGPGEGERNPRLFAWVETGTDGTFDVDTILPGAYGGAPPHFHMAVAPSGDTLGDQDGARIGCRLYFDTGEPVHPEIRSDVAAGVAWLLSVARRADGVWVGEGELRLRPH